MNFTTVCRIRPSSQAGFTLLELIMVVGIVGILASIAMSSYSKYLYRAEITQVLIDIGAISRRIDLFKAETGHFPATLDDAGGVMLDPWGNPYEYLRIDDAGDSGSTNTNGKGNGGGGLGKLRKDKNLVPINSDYDLYSKGRDGASVSPLTAEPSRDDIVRASNGAYVGLAEQY